VPLGKGKKREKKPPGVKVRGGIGNIKFKDFKQRRVGGTEQGWLRLFRRRKLGGGRKDWSHLEVAERKGVAKVTGKVSVRKR